MNAGYGQHFFYYLWRRSEAAVTRRTRNRVGHKASTLHTPLTHRAFPGILTLVNQRISTLFLRFASGWFLPMRAINSIRSGIEEVITALTRNQVISQEVRGFESHSLRHKPVCGPPQAGFPFICVLFQTFQCACRLPVFTLSATRF